MTEHLEAYVELLSEETIRNSVVVKDTINYVEQLQENGVITEEEGIEYIRYVLYIQKKKESLER